LQLIDDIAREREELRAKKQLCTSFVEDLKNKVLGIDRPLKETKDKPFQKKCGTWFNADGTVMVAKDTGKV